MVSLLLLGQQGKRIQRGRSTATRWFLPPNGISLGLGFVDGHTPDDKTIADVKKMIKEILIFVIKYDRNIYL